MEFVFETKRGHNTSTSLIAYLERPQKRSLLLDSLELAMPKLARRINKLQRNLFQIPSAGVNHQTLPDSQDALLGAGDRTLEHEEVILHDSVVRESTEGSDALVCRISVRRTVLGVSAGADSVDLFVQFGTVMISICGGEGVSEIE